MGDLFDRQKNRDDILNLQGSIESGLESGDINPVDCPVKHHFAPGLYAREIFMPKGATVIGKIHKHSHVNTISMGKVLVSTEADGLEEFEAPYSFVSKPGTKRAVYMLEDTIWTTYHPTDETDLEEIEKHVIAPSFEDYEIFLCYEQKEQERLQ